MFSGIIKYLGTTKRIVPSSGPGEAVILELNSELFSADDRIAIGSSVAVSGVCLTVTELAGESATFEIGSESLRRTKFGSTSSTIKPGTQFNLERSLALNDLLEGHLVSGHVDCIVKVLTIEKQSAATVKLTLECPAAVLPLLAPKGSVALDGVSLTVGEVAELKSPGDAELSAGWFSVYIIPYTLQNTTLHGLSAGDFVNLEVDPFARYVARQLKFLAQD